MAYRRVIREAKARIPPMSRAPLPIEAMSVSVSPETGIDRIPIWIPNPMADANVPIEAESPTIGMMMMMRRFSRPVDLSHKILMNRMVQTTTETEEMMIAVATADVTSLIFLPA